MAPRPLIGDVKKEMASARYKLWRVTHAADHKKILLELEGSRRPLSNDPYARIIIESIRDVTPPKPPPVTASTMAPIWKRDAVFTRSLSSFSGVERNAAREADFSVVYVQLDHTAHAEANKNEIPVFVREGWTVVGWATYGQDTDPYEDGKRAAAISRGISSLRGWKPNGELWAEGQSAWKTGEFLRGWRDGGGLVQLGWSILSSDTASHVRLFDYQAALTVAGADLDFQVYGASNGSYTVGACLAHAKAAGLPADRIAMSFDVKPAVPGPKGTGPFSDYNQWKGPRRVWTGDDSTVATFQALDRA